MLNVHFNFAKTLLHQIQRSAVSDHEMHSGSLCSSLQFTRLQARKERNLKTVTFASLSPSSLFTTLS